MKLLNRDDGRIDQLTEALAEEVAQSEWLQESLAQLELQLDEIGWQRLAAEADWEFSRDGLDRIIALSRLNAIKNPLIKRGVGLKAHYVFGQGVEIQADDPDVNDLVVQPFVDDPGNRTELFGHRARMAKDRALTVDGQVCFVLFTDLYGKVELRSVDVLEVREIICNPEDRTEPWLYRRVWVERDFMLAGGSSRTRTVSREAFYPDWRWRPKVQPESIDGIPVRWDSPIYHARVGGLDGMRYGLPETYAALDWAKAYKAFLEDWATLVRSLSRFAWKQKVKRNPAAAAARMTSTVSPSAPHERNPGPAAGAVFAAAEGTDLTPIPKSGATVDADDGLWLAKMVAAALDVPITMLLGDPDQGNLATAKTLDRPTELAMQDRQKTWGEIIDDLCQYAIDRAVIAPGGKLAGDISREGNRLVVTLPDTTVDGEVVSGARRRTVNVIFPPILEQDTKELVEAITKAAATELPAPTIILRLLLTALGVENIDDHLADFDEDEWLASRGNLGQGLVDAFRRGDDAVAMLNDPEGDGS